jgi:hypothetical protein
MDRVAIFEVLEGVLQGPLREARFLEECLAGELAVLLEDVEDIPGAGREVRYRRRTLPCHA